MSLRGTKQSHAIQNGFASVRLPRYARNDIVLYIIYLIKNKPLIARHEAIPKLYRADLLIGDCFVPRNDDGELYPT